MTFRWPFSPARCTNCGWAQGPLSQFERLPYEDEYHDDAMRATCDHQWGEWVMEPGRRPYRVCDRCGAEDNNPPHDIQLQ